MIDRDYVLNSIKTFCGKPPYMVQIDSTPAIFGGYFNARKEAANFIWENWERMSRNCPSKRLPDAHVYHGDYIGRLTLVQEEKNEAD